METRKTSNKERKKRKEKGRRNFLRSLVRKRNADRGKREAN